MSAAPAPLRAATVAGAILAVIFIILSAVVGGINVWRTHSAAGYDEQAAQAQSDKAALDKQITEAKTRLDARVLLIDPRRDQVLRLRDAGRQGHHPHRVRREGDARQRPAHPLGR